MGNFLDEIRIKFAPLDSLVKGKTWVTTHQTTADSFAWIKLNFNTEIPFDILSISKHLSVKHTHDAL